MRVLMFLMMALSLTGCGHSALKAPCPPTASLGSLPCETVPVNLAAAITAQHKSV